MPSRLKSLGLVPLFLVAVSAPSVAQVAPIGGSSSVAVTNFPSAFGSADQNAAITGKAWSVGTGVVSIPANQQLDAVLANPAGSGCTAMFTLRRFINTSTTMLQYSNFNNPNAITTNAPSVGNRIVGRSPSTGMTFGFATRAAGSMGGTAGVSAPLLATTDEKIDAPLVLPPGASFGVSILGQNGALLTSAVTVSMTFVGYCL